MTPVTILVTGIARIGHIPTACWPERPPWAGLLGPDRFRSSDRPDDLLRRVTGWHIRQVDRIKRTYLDDRARLAETFVIADLDLSVRSAEVA